MRVAKECVSHKLYTTFLALKLFTQTQHKHDMAKGNNTGGKGGGGKGGGKGGGGGNKPKAESLASLKKKGSKTVFKQTFASPFTFRWFVFFLSFILVWFPLFSYCFSRPQLSSEDSSLILRSLSWFV